MKKNSRILVLGDKNLTAEALICRLKKDGFSGILSISAKDDLTNKKFVDHFFNTRRPDYVFLIDVISGGIEANYKYPANFLYKNLQAQINVIDSAWRYKVKKLLFTASSCSYPKGINRPIKEDELLTGSLESTSEAFSIAKIAGIKMCEFYNTQYGTDFISVIPATIYGPRDNFDLNTAHVVPALFRKFHQAKIKGKNYVTVWGSGKPLREFLHVDDMVDAVIFLMNKSKVPNLINIGCGSDISIRQIAMIIKDITDFKGDVKFDPNKPDGVRRKLLDANLINSLGWKAKVDIRTGMADLYRWYQNNVT